MPYPLDRVKLRRAGWEMLHVQPGMARAVREKRKGDEMKKKDLNAHLFGPGPKRILALDGGGIRGFDIA